MKVAFVHRGDQRFVRIAAAQAESIGCEVVLIADQNIDGASCEYFDIARFQNGAQDFRKKYKHISVNPFEYELFCFERWFILKDYMLETGRQTEGLLLIDHDILLYPGIFKAIDLLVAEYPEPMPLFDTAWINYISNAANLETLTSKFLGTYENDEFLHQVAKRNMLGDAEHVSDMHLLVEFGHLFRSEFAMMSTLGCERGFDNNIRIGNGYILENGHKIVRWEDNRPFVVRTDGKRQEFCCLHFQGPSKYLMSLMQTVEDTKVTSLFANFDSSIAALPFDDLGVAIKAQYAALLCNASGLRTGTQYSEKDEVMKDEEIATFATMWEGGYYEGDPMDPGALSQYSAIDARSGYPDRSGLKHLKEREIGFLSVVYVTYIMCIRNRVRGKRVLEIGPGRGAWSKAILIEGAKSLQVLDALSAEYNKFYEYVDPDGKYRNRIAYHCVDDFKCEGIADRSIDFFFSFGCFCHISRRGTASYFADLANKMVSGAEGFIMISDYHKMHAAIGATPASLDVVNDDLNFEEDNTPSPGRWYHLGKHWFSDMITREGFTVLDIDIGCNVRDPIVHFRR